MFPKFLYHADHDAFVRTSQTEYPIRISTQEELDALEPGWCEDPVEAANFATPRLADGESQRLADLAAQRALARAEEVRLAAEQEAERKKYYAEQEAKDLEARIEAEKAKAIADAPTVEVKSTTQDAVARAMAASRSAGGDSK